MSAKTPKLVFWLKRSWNKRFERWARTREMTPRSKGENESFCMLSRLDLFGIERNFVKRFALPVWAQDRSHIPTFSIHFFRLPLCTHGLSSNMNHWSTRREVLRFRGFTFPYELAHSTRFYRINARKRCHFRAKILLTDAEGRRRGLTSH